MKTNPSIFRCLSACSPGTGQFVRSVRHSRGGQAGNPTGPHAWRVHCGSALVKRIPVLWPEGIRDNHFQIVVRIGKAPAGLQRQFGLWRLMALALAGTTVLLCAGCQKKSESAGPSSARVENHEAVIEPNSAPAGSVTVEEAVAPARVILAFNGRIVWNDNVTTRLFSPFAGRVTQIAAEVGDHVESGALLCAIASPDFGQAQADARRAAADFSLAESTAVRLRALLEHGAAAPKDVQSAEADLERAKLEKSRTVKRLELYGTGTDLDQAFALKSPIAGIIVEKNVSPGAELRNDQMLANTPQLAAPLFVITDPTKLWIQIDVPQRDQGRVRVGDNFVVRSESLPGETFAGRVEVVADSLDPNTRTLKLRGSLTNPDRRLKAESFVKAEFSLPPAAGVEVSSRAVFLRGEKHRVLVEEKPGRYAIRDVVVGSEHAGRSIITHGVEAGQRIVVEGAMLLEQMIESAPST